MRSSISCCTDSPKDPGASIDSRPQGYNWGNGKGNGNYSNIGFIGKMEEKMEATIILGVILG